MSTLSLQLLKFQENIQECIDPRAYIAIKLHTTVKTENNIEFQCLSPECRTSEEIQYNAEQLIKELKVIQRQARSFFKKEQQKHT